MPETIQIDEDLELIKITSHGKVTKKDLSLSRRTVSDMLYARGFKRVLVDVAVYDGNLYPLH